MRIHSKHLYGCTISRVVNNSKLLSFVCICFSLNVRSEFPHVVCSDVIELCQTFIVATVRKMCLFNRLIFSSVFDVL